MKDKIKKFLKRYLIGFTLGLLSAGIVVVYAQTYFPSNQTTYDNSGSGMQATNVQSAIDELYMTCFPPKTSEDLIENITTTGDGLYKDEYECRYFYRGGNPNNYITFNDEEAGWRILSIECDGTIKIIRNESIGNIAWNTSKSNNWDRPASLNTYLNETYYNTLTSSSKQQITSHTFNIGGVTSILDLSQVISEENQTTWEGNIALITSSEYTRVNSNQTQCGTNVMISQNYSTCKPTHWLQIDNGWTLTKYNMYNYLVLTLFDNGTIFESQEGSVTANSLSVYPTLYLSSEIKLSGSGTQSDPFTIE